MTATNESKLKLIRLPKVIELTGRSRTRIYADIKSKCFPQAVKIGPRSVAWVEQEIFAWIEEKRTQQIDD